MNTDILLSQKIPSYVKHIHDVLTRANFEVFLVGGCVRDILLGLNPKDWDMTTNAKPENIIKLFEHTVYENSFGTVAIVCDWVEGEVKPIIEITPFRTETTYSDKRHPDSVSFSNRIEDDLLRRDFTINALALNIQTLEIKDYFKGQNDLSDRVLRTVGNSDDRFTEDALRMLRAIRFAVQLGFSISYETLESISKNKELLKDISWERKRDEFSKMMLSSDPVMAIGLLEQTGLLQYLVPELREGIGCDQKGAHIYDVFNHMLHALGHAQEKEWPLHIRLAALFHDIGKPRTRRYDKKKDKYTFYGHEVVGAHMTKKIMERFVFPRETTDLVTTLVRYHMFFSDTDIITLSPVRRMIQNVGVNHIWELMQIRECDRVGMKKTEAPIRLRKYHAMIEEALRDPISVSQLKIDGTFLIQEFHMKPGPRIGSILLALLEDVLEDPKINTVDMLSERVKQLDLLSDNELKNIALLSKQKKDELNVKEVQQLHVKHGVQKKNNNK